MGWALGVGAIDLQRSAAPLLLAAAALVLVAALAVVVAARPGAPRGRRARAPRPDDAEREAYERLLAGGRASGAPGGGRPQERGVSTTEFSPTNVTVKPTMNGTFSSKTDTSPS